MNSEIEINFLLVMPAHRQPVLLTDNRQHRLVIGLGIIKTVQQMDCARPGGRKADPDLTGVLRMGAGHERRQLFMARLDELEPVLCPGEGANQPVNAVAGVSRRHFFFVAPDWRHVTGTMMAALGGLRGFVGERR